MSTFSSELHRLYAEDKVQFHTEFYKLVHQVVARVAPSYPANIYNHGAKWSESFDEVTHDVYVERLLNPMSNQLDYIMIEAKSLSSIEALVVKQVKQVIYSRARKTPVQNLIRRTRAMAEAGQIHCREFHGVKYYCITADFPADLPQTSDADIVRAVNRARDIPIIWGHLEAERQSKVYSASDLRRVMDAILAEVLCISEQSVWRVFELLLTPFVPSVLSLYEDQIENNASHVHEQLMIEVEQPLIDFVERLSEEELCVLIAKSQGITDMKICELIKKSRPTVASIKSRVESRIKDTFKMLGENDSVEAVMIRMIELANKRMASLEVSQ